MGKVALILSGCGHLDGSEIHETTLCMLYLAKYHHELECFAPNKAQKQVMNHVNREKEKKETRNALVEAARITRGRIKPIEELNVEKFDACLLPGGMGAVLQFSDFEEKRVNCQIDSLLKEKLIAFHRTKKPIGATCIAPVLIAKSLQSIAKVKMTLGSDLNYQKLLEQMGMEGKLAKVTECIADTTHLVYTTPCYMEPEDLAGMSQGIENLVKSFLAY